MEWGKLKWKVVREWEKLVVEDGKGIGNIKSGK